MPFAMLLFGTIAFDTGQLETAYKFLALYVELQGGDIQGELASAQRKAERTMSR